MFPHSIIHSLGITQLSKAAAELSFTPTTQGEEKGKEGREKKRGRETEREGEGEREGEEKREKGRDGRL